MSDDLEYVNYDPDLHRYHKDPRRWNEWIHSREYGTAFKAYWKEGTVPYRIYPKSLIIKNKKEGTVSYIPLEGTHDWKETERSDKPYQNFMRTAIYNRELARWANKRQKNRSRMRAKKSASKSLNHLKYKISHLPWLHIITWAFVLTIAYILSKNIPLPEWGVIIYPLTTILLIVCFAKTYAIVGKIAYICLAIIGGIITLIVFGILSEEAIFVISLITIFAIIALSMIIIELIVTFLSYAAKWMGIAFGGVFGGKAGWNMADRLFGKRR